MFRVTMCPTSGERTVSKRHWYFSRCMGGWLVCWLGCLIPTSQSPIQSEKCQCRIDKVSSPDDGLIVATNKRSWNKCTKKQCAPSWLRLKQIIQGCTVNKTLKKESSPVTGSHYANSNFRRVRKLANSTVSFVMSVRPSVSLPAHVIKLGSHWTVVSWRRGFH